MAVILVWKGPVLPELGATAFVNQYLGVTCDKIGQGVGLAGLSVLVKLSSPPFIPNAITTHGIHMSWLKKFLPVAEEAPRGFGAGFGFQVLKNTSPLLEIEPWFDYICGINGRPIVSPLHSIPTRRQV